MGDGLTGPDVVAVGVGCCFSFSLACADLKYDTPAQPAHASAPIITLASTLPVCSFNVFLARSAPNNHASRSLRRRTATDSMT